MPTFFVNRILQSKTFREYFLSVFRYMWGTQSNTTPLSYSPELSLLEVEVDTRNTSFNNDDMFNDIGQ